MTAAHPPPVPAGALSQSQTLAPEMASFKLLVLGFIRDYIGLMGASPSYGEIAARFHSNRKRVMKAVLSLEREGLLIRTRGQRGLRLPSLRDAAIRQLRDQGWVLDEEAKTGALPSGWLDASVPVTKRGLLTMPALDYQPE